LTEQYISEQETLDYRAALICSIIAEVNRDRKKRSKPYTAKDFMPERRAKKKQHISDTQMLNRAQVITKMLGGEVK
jgi:hypothetical protein